MIDLVRFNYTHIQKPSKEKVIHMTLEHDDWMHEGQEYSALLDFTPAKPDGFAEEREPVIEVRELYRWGGMERGRLLRQPVWRLLDLEDKANSEVIQAAVDTFRERWPYCCEWGEEEGCSEDKMEKLRQMAMHDAEMEGEE